MTALLRFDSVEFHYGRRAALDSVSLEFGNGVTGLLGPNGAGKSTLMQVAATALPLQSGGVVVAGHHLANRAGRNGARREIGYLPQQFDVMGWSSVRRNIEYAAWAHGIGKADLPQAVERTLNDVGLADRASDRARSLSGGMRQRLGIGCAIAHRPKVLILDEPTVGLDPLQRTAIRQLLDDLGRDACVVVSTHLVEDLQAIAKSVVVLANGTIRFTGTITELIELAAQDTPNPALSPLERGYQAAVVRDPTQHP